ncbi:Gamma-aminobutyric acid receptor subunit beta [Amphibalanus amphitrite]|uniref:Gamma-aminobutyric acid receptor subunit beta n=1 Tax=Amphibalanus amphitrite TaxID=1232801 RepID=A0A6A4VKX5_AMPAM|nr:Gamma-aminobutyric acid receptor subunit beta [Amphibalanus amphitrite]
MVSIWTMIRRRNSGRAILIFLLLVSVDRAVQSQSRVRKNVGEESSLTTDQPESAITTKAEEKRVTWDPNNPADGTDRHSRDHLHDFDHYEKAHGHAKDHEGQSIIYDHPHHDDEEGHDDLHHMPWVITKPGYDIRHRPDNDEPTKINISLFHDFIEYVDELGGEMVIKLFVVAYWKDHRMRNVDEVLNEVGGTKESRSLPLPSEMKYRLWVPDLYLPMARRVRVPTIHQPAESVTLKENGTMKYSSFFVISFKCEMHYHNYPMDVQQCDLDIFSYKYASSHLQLLWQRPYGLVGALRINTKHFDVRVMRPKGKSWFLLHGPGGSTKDVLRITYVMRRHLSFHLLQTYLPSIMLVFIGWLSLLVPLDFAYGRMVLSVTTLLVLVSFFVTTSQTTPGTNEVKALDIWLFICIFFVFSAIVDCIADLRFLSMVEKESQIAGEEGVQSEMPPVVDERVRRLSRPDDGGQTAGDDSDRADATHNVQFFGDNTPFQADKEVLIATPSVIKWLRLAVLLERGMTVAYPALFVLFTAVYWAVYITARSSHIEPESDD